jgi:iron(III) transport system substrate-binding protein
MQSSKIPFKTSHRATPPVIHFLWAAVVIFLFTGCINRQTDEVVVLSALDREFADPVLEDVRAQLKMPLRIKYDVESNKTVGLTNEIIRNQQRPRADLFWNNEILHTIRLQKLGLLEPVDASRRSRFPDRFVSPSGHWFGFAARARVLIVNTDLMPDADQRPTSIDDLADSQFAGKCTLARPFFGTSATHAAVMFDVLGEIEATELYEKIADNAIIQGGNKQVAEKVAAGEFLFGLTDTDDALVELDAGRPVAIVYPDQGAEQSGALLIPNTLCVIKNGPNTAGAKRLLERLMAADVEARLANGRSGQIPLADDVQEKSRVVNEDLKVMEVDFESAADQWEAAAIQLKTIFPLGQ